jgi:two-component system, chemotaxis family, protein-glutamate methylesterase/glutaminase
MSGPITVLVVDDSALMRKLVTDIFSSDPAFLVLGQARDGADALKKVEALRPQLVTLDVEMPVMDGLSALTEIMRRFPTPVIMLSSLTQAGADMTFRCLDAGAVDFVGKPSGSISLDIKRVDIELLQKAKEAVRANVHRLATPAKKIVPVSITRPQANAPMRSASYSHRSGVLVIGASTGGPRALQLLVPALPGNLEVPVVIIQHMPPGFTVSLAKRLDSESALTVREAVAGDVLRPGHILIAPGGPHLQFHAQGMACITDEPPIHGVRPAIDVTLASLIHLYGANIVPILLTGMGKDGARSLKMLHDMGAETFAEDESTCVVYGMPKAADELGGVSHLLPLQDLAAAAVEAVHHLGHAKAA